VGFNSKIYSSIHLDLTTEKQVVLQMSKITYHDVKVVFACLWVSCGGARQLVPWTIDPIPFWTGWTIGPT